MLVSLLEVPLDRLTVSPQIPHATQIQTPGQLFYPLTLTFLKCLVAHVWSVPGTLNQNLSRCKCRVRESTHQAGIERNAFTLKPAGHIMDNHTVPVIVNLQVAPEERLHQSRVLASNAVQLAHVARLTVPLNCIENLGPQSGHIAV